MGHKPQKKLQKNLVVLEENGFLAGIAAAAKSLQSWLVPT